MVKMVPLVDKFRSRYQWYQLMTANNVDNLQHGGPPQKYRLGTISNTKLLAGLNRFYMAITSPSAIEVVPFDSAIQPFLLVHSTAKCFYNQNVIALMLKTDLLDTMLLAHLSRRLTGELIG